MKKITLFLGFLSLSTAFNAQVGINTPTPQTTLDVVGNGASASIKDGFRAPRITKQQLASKSAGVYGATESGALVYVTDVTAPSGTTPSLTQVAEVTGAGYYYFDGSIWKQVVNSTGFTNIYNANGTITTNRTVSQGTNTLTFANSATTGTNHFSVDGTTFSVDAVNDRIGIGTTTPETKLQVISGTAISNRYNIIDAANSTNQYAFLALRNTSPLATGNFSLLGFTNSGPTSGGANWGLGSIRTGATAVNGSEEDLYIGNSLGGSLLERFRITSAGNVGIGTSTPARRLHVNANSSAVRFESLATLPTNTAATGLVIDTNGDIYKNNTVSVEGQILRIGLNAVTYTTTGEVGLRFNSNDSTAEMGNAPNSAPNFINTIVGATINDGVTATAGQGSPARTADQILLQPGIYKIQVRLVGNFAATSSLNNLFLKSIVNNNEYSLVNFTNNSNQTTTYYFDDFINITGAAQTVDFTILPGTNTFTTASSQSPSTGNSYRSLILIQRLR